MRLLFKPLYVMTIWMFATSVFAQNTVVDQHVAADSIASKSVLKNYLQDKYNLVLSYSVGCAMGEVQTYYAFGYRDERWEKIELKVRFKSRNRVYDQVKKIQAKKQRLKDSSQIDNLLQFWDQNEICKLNADSVNVNTQKVLEEQSGKVKENLVVISDGCVFTLEMFDEVSYCFISSYEPERYQEQIPIPQREKFIQLKDKFLQYWDTVR